MTSSKEADMQTPKSPRAGTMLKLDWWRDPRFDLGSSARDFLMKLLSYSADYTTDGRVKGGMYRSLLADQFQTCQLGVAS